MYKIARSLFFSLPTETSHWLALKSIDIANTLHLLPKLVETPVAGEPVSVFGLQFPNRIGLAAGLDKNGDHIASLGKLGFGFIEVGTVTPRPQLGNPKPRLFRLPSEEAIINRMGFNNKGVLHLASRVAASSYRGIVGINIGKNKDTPAEKAVDDYVLCMQQVYQQASYITVNLSSPNTPGLRDLQFGQPLNDLLQRLKQEQMALMAKHDCYKPLLVKVAPDMSDDDLKRMAAAFLEHGIDGVIATNTTILRDKVAGHKHAEEAGGLSGRPLSSRSTQVIAQLYAELGEEIPIIGVGGIFDEQTAREKLLAGAKLLQIYSGFIYEGPSLVNTLVKATRS